MPPVFFAVDPVTRFLSFLISFFMSFIPLAILVPSKQLAPASSFLHLGKASFLFLFGNAVVVITKHRDAERFAGRYIVAGDVEEMVMELRLVPSFHHPGTWDEGGLPFLGKYLRRE